MTVWVSKGIQQHKLAYQPKLQYWPWVSYHIRKSIDAVLRVIGLSLRSKSIELAAVLFQPKMFWKGAPNCINNLRVFPYHTSFGLSLPLFLKTSTESNSCYLVISETLPSTCSKEPSGLMERLRQEATGKGSYLWRTLKMHSRHR